MQRVLDVLKNGYTHVVLIDVPISKGFLVIEKLQERFPMLTKTRSSASRAKMATDPKPRHKCVVFWNSSSSRCLIYLFTDQPRTEDRENWCCILNKQSRVTFYEYEAIRYANGDEYAWTWQIEKNHLRRMQQELIKAIRKRDFDYINDLISKSRKWPGFKAVRRQHKTFGMLMTRYWKREAVKETMPDWPWLYYLQRIATR